MCPGRTPPRVRGRGDLPCLTGARPHTQHGCREGDTLAQEIRLLVGDDSNLVLLRSADNARTWSDPETLIADVEVPTIVGAPDGSVYAGTRGKGLFCSRDGVSDWQAVVTLPELAIVRSLCFGQGRFIAGTEPAGVYERDSRGEWHPLGDIMRTPGAEEWFYPVPTEAVHIRYLALDPHEHNRIYAAVQVGGVAISPDNGATWEDKRNLDLDVHMVEPHPSRPGVVYAGTGGGGFYRSTDYGETWECISEGLGNFVVQFTLDPHDPDRIYLGTGRGHPPHWAKTGGAGGEMFRSDDAGQTWRKLSGNLPDPMGSRINTVVVDPGNQENVFFAGGLNFRGTVAQDGGVYLSGDAGESWQRILASREPLALWCSRG